MRTPGRCGANIAIGNLQLQTDFLSPIGNLRLDHDGAAVVGERALLSEGDKYRRRIFLGIEQDFELNHDGGHSGIIQDGSIPNRRCCIRVRRPQNTDAKNDRKIE